MRRALDTTPDLRQRARLGVVGDGVEPRVGDAGFALLFQPLVQRLRELRGRDPQGELLDAIWRGLQ